MNTIIKNYVKNQNSIKGLKKIKLEKILKNGFIYSIKSPVMAGMNLSLKQYNIKSSLTK